MTKSHNKFTEHILILGWSQTTSIMLKELSASSISKNQQIVMLAQKEPEPESLTGLEKNFFYLKGNPSLRENLLQVDATQAQKICINLLGQTDGDLQTLSIFSTLQQLFNEENADPLLIALLAKEQYRQKLITSGVDPDTLISVETLFPCIAAQVCRQKYLKAVFNEILSVAGNEIYQYPIKDFVGYTWSKVLRAFDNACPIGIKQNNTFFFNPDQGTLITEDTDLFVLSSDLQGIHTAPPLLPAPDYKEIVRGTIASREEESFLFLGWGAEGKDLVSNLAVCCSPSTTILIISENDPEISNFTQPNLSISWQKADPHKDEILEAIQFEFMENIILFGSSGLDSSAEIELFHRVKNILARTGLTNNITILFGPLTEETKTIPEALSTDIITTLATQIILHPPLLHLLRELVQPEGSNIHLKPVENYVEIDSEVNFYTIIEAARRKNETAIGYISHIETGTQVCLNPLKTQKKRFYHFDKIIVF